MFELLTKQKRTRLNSNDNLVFPFIKDVDIAEDVSNQLIDVFKKKNEYHGISLIEYSLKLLSLLSNEKEISQGAFFISDLKDGKSVLRFLSGYAAQSTDSYDNILEFGEGFPGQVAKDSRMINISNIPEGYLSIESGLGKSSQVSLIIFPVKHNDKVIAVIELASFHKFTRDDESFFSEISPAIAEQILKCKTKF